MRGLRRFSDLSKTPIIPQGFPHEPVSVTIVVATFAKIPQSVFLLFEERGEFFCSKRLDKAWSHGAVWSTPVNPSGE